MWASSAVVDYVVEEVSRQGHNILDTDGIERVGWMLGGWAFALHRAARIPYAHMPELEDAITIGRLVEPDRNRGGLRTVNVQVMTNTGPKIFPDHERVREMLTLLFEQRNQLKPMEFYKEFENIHPFVDGNGRTGKILLNWLNCTLLRPIFPPNDLFGESIRNP